MRTRHTVILFTAIFMIGLVGNQAAAATKGRIMTNGKITMYKNDRVVATYTSQGPVDENALIACQGNCLVKMQGISLSAVDQTKFAVKETADSLNLYVESGKIYFIISDAGHTFSFFTPGNQYIKSEGFIAPASTGSAIKGSIEVTDTATTISMDSGSMLVQNGAATETITPGNALVLAMANPPEEDDDDDDKAGIVPCSFFDFTCNTPVQKGLIVAGGVGAVVGAGIIIDNSGGGGGGTSASPNQ